MSHRPADPTICDLLGLGLLVNPKAMECSVASAHKFDVFRAAPISNSLET